MLEAGEEMMLLSMKDSAGRTLDAFVLAVSPNRMRLAVRDFSDVLELNYAYGAWKTEEGLVIEIESILTDGRPLDQAILAHCASRVKTAGGN
jgi:hypothetical protein